MAYIKIKDRNLKTLKVKFISKDINVSKKVREDRVERFRQDILFMNGKEGVNYPHAIKIEY